MFYDTARGGRCSPEMFSPETVSLLLSFFYILLVVKRKPQRTAYLPRAIKMIWWDRTWSRCAHFSSVALSLGLFSGTMKISAVVGNPGSTVTRSWSSLIPVTFYNNNKTSLKSFFFFLHLKQFEVFVCTRLWNTILGGGGVICING